MDNNNVRAVRRKLLVVGGLSTTLPSLLRKTLLPHVPLFEDKGGVIAWTSAALWLLGHPSVTKRILGDLRGRFFDAVWTRDARSRHEQFRHLAIQLTEHRRVSAAALGAALLSIVDEQRDAIETRTKSEGETFDNES